MGCWLWSGAGQELCTTLVDYGLARVPWVEGASCVEQFTCFLTNFIMLTTCMFIWGIVGGGLLHIVSFWYLYPAEDGASRNLNIRFHF